LACVKSAITNSGYKYPKTQSLVNLAPADVKKVGPAFDLPVALGMLIGQGVLVSSVVKDFVIVGELALDGRVRPVNGVLNMAMTANANGFSRMVVPLENAKYRGLWRRVAGPGGWFSFRTIAAGDNDG
jgi:magnesium chelatase family protein